METGDGRMGMYCNAAGPVGRIDLCCRGGGGGRGFESYRSGSH